MLIKVLIGLAVFVAALVVLIASRPSTFSVQRSVVIGAPVDVIFPYIDNPRTFQSWNPFAEADPNIRNSYSGPAEGVGSSLAWVGNKQVGEGRMTTLESRPGELVRFKLEFFKPFAGTNTALFTLKPEGDQTVVTWKMYGPANFTCKAMRMLINCDKMCGDQFQKGLANLKTLAETQHQSRESASKVTLVAP